MPTYARPIASKLPNVGTTIFTVMSRLAQEHKAINLSQGFPDFDCAKELRDLVTKYINAGLNQYPPSAGIPQLRERVAQKVESLYGTKYDVEGEVTIVPGATYGIYTAVSALVRPGDEVILFEPAYDSYAPAVEVNGGVPVYVQLRYPDYGIDWQQVQQAITPKTRAVIINTPNNPTASVFSGEDMRMLEGLLRGTGIVVISDEVYEHIVFDGHQHQSVARFPGLAERSFVVSSFGKTYHVTGWKMGYVAAPKEQSRIPTSRCRRSTRRSAIISCRGSRARASSLCPRAERSSRTWPTTRSAMRRTPISRYASRRKRAWLPSRCRSSTGSRRRTRCCGSASRSRRKPWRGERRYCERSEMEPPINADKIKN